MLKTKKSTFAMNGSVILNKRDYGRVITNRKVPVGFKEPKNTF